MSTPSRFTRGRRPAGGFTLVEAMLALAVLAILAAIALPAYSEYVQRAKLVEANIGLADLRTRLEQHFLDARAYPSTCVAPAPGPAAAGQIYLPAGSRYFRFDCALTATTYLVTATGAEGEGMAGFAFAVDEMGRRTTVALPAGWRGTGSPCWVSRKSGEC